MKGVSMVKKSLYLKLIISLVAVFVLASGCSNQDPEDDESEAISNHHQNPFEADEPDQDEEQMIEAVGHGFVNSEMDESGTKRLPINYDGGELEIDYSINAVGKNKDFGLLIFIDGIPQPYKIDTTEAPYEYMHIFNPEKDDVDMLFTLVFTPVTGKKGDTLDITISSTYNPSFTPDMKETSSYGGYQSTLEVSNRVVFNQNPEAFEPSNIPQDVYVSNVQQTTEPITNDLLEKHGVDLETLDTQMLTEFEIDGENVELIGNLQIDDKGTLKVRYKIFGQPGVRYQTTFYIDHKAIKSKDVGTFETVMAKGDVAIIDVEIDVEKLADLNTFYIVSVPTNGNEFYDNPPRFLRTLSVLLYK